MVSYQLEVGRATGRGVWKGEGKGAEKHQKVTQVFGSFSKQNALLKIYQTKINHKTKEFRSTFKKLYKKHAL